MIGGHHRRASPSRWNHDAVSIAVVGAEFINRIEDIGIVTRAGRHIVFGVGEAKGGD